MNWEHMEDRWQQYTGQVKQQWGDLTDDDLKQVNGSREELEARLQQRYGYSRSEASNEVDNWLDTLT